MHDYRNEEIISFVESIGYKHRTGNYYVFTEIDGYINVSYYKLLEQNGEKINFYKNYYSGYYKYPNVKEDINKTFDNFNDFDKYMSIYHKKEVRKLKMKKLETL
jgi:hypothetical protein